MKDSWGVLMRDKELLLFPVASGVATFLVLLTFIVPFIGAAFWGSRAGPSDTVFYVVLFCYYLCNFFVIVYFNAALVAHVVTRLRGGEPTIGRASAPPQRAFPRSRHGQSSRRRSASSCAGCRIARASWPRSCSRSSGSRGRS